MKIKSIEEDRIVFDNGNYLCSEHINDCCEAVFADFGHIQVLTNIGANQIDSDILDFDENIISSIKKADCVGFEIIDKHGIRLLVSCYNVQNGYYSSDLSLVYRDKFGNIVDTTDITECCEDHDGWKGEPYDAEDWDDFFNKFSTVEKWQKVKT